jgi:hypothetical protein
MIPSEMKSLLHKSFSRSDIQVKKSLKSALVFLPQTNILNHKTTHTKKICIIKNVNYIFFNYFDFFTGITHHERRIVRKQ